MKKTNELMQPCQTTTASTATSLKYMKFSDIFQSYTSENLDKINLYGVITYISNKQNQKTSAHKDGCTLVTLVDPSCGFDDSLKINVFQPESDTNTIHNLCEIGDIIRFHRVKIQPFNGKPQAVSLSKTSSWIRFKLKPPPPDQDDSNQYTFEGNKSNNTFDDHDKLKVKQIREWVNTGPNINSLIEANLSVRKDAQPEKRKSNEHVQPSTSAANTSMTALSTSNDSHSSMTLSTIKAQGYYDLVCQVCAVCDKKGCKFLLVWDSTKTNLAIFRDSDFLIDATCDAPENQKIFFSKSAIEYFYNVYVYDEFQSCLSQIQPGDFIMLKNAQARPIPHGTSCADLIIKMPGASSASSRYGRMIKRLATFEEVKQIDVQKSPKQILKNLDADTASIIKNIYEKGKELGMAYVNEDEFLNQYKKSFTTIESSNDTLEELLANDAVAKSKAATTARRPLPNLNSQKQGHNLLDQVNKMLEDETEMYENDDDTSHEEENMQQNNQVNQNNQNQSYNQRNTTVQVGTVRPIIIPATMSKNTQNDLILKDHQQTNNKTRKMAKNKKTPEGEEPNEDDQDEDGMFAIAKKVKKIHITEICPEIEKLKRLVKLTYLAPYIQQLDSKDGQQSYFPHYQSLKYLKEDSERNDYLKCEVTAKIFSYSISSSPHIGSVFVYCKQCSYVNFIPFHLSNIYQEPYLKIVLKQTNDENDHQPTQFDPTGHSTYDLANKRAVNYSLEWLKTALPVEMVQLLPSQVAMASQANNKKRINEEEDTGVIIYKYACPRCELNNHASRASQSQVGNSQTQTQTDVTFLDYMYRFWFKLRDFDSYLDPCLMESDVALKFLNDIDPLKFFTNQAKSNAVYKTIHTNMDKKYLFTLETFKLAGAEDQADTRKLKILYKIVDFHEFAN